MGLTTIVVAVCLLAVTSEGVNFPRFGFPYPQMSFMPALPLPEPPPLPNGIKPPPLMTPPPLLVFGNEGFPGFIHVPTPQEIFDANMKMNRNFNGVFVSSASTSGGRGQTQIYVNNNGEIYSETFPNQPGQPEPSIPNFRSSGLQGLDQNGVSGSKNFQGFSVTSSSHYSNKDGVVSSGGIITSTFNDGGNVKQEVLQFGDI